MDANKHPVQVPEEQRPCSASTSSRSEGWSPLQDFRRPRRARGEAVARHHRQDHHRSVDAARVNPFAGVQPCRAGHRWATRATTPPTLADEAGDNRRHAGRTSRTAGALAALETAVLSPRVDEGAARAERAEVAIAPERARADHADTEAPQARRDARAAWDVLATSGNSSIGTESGGFTGRMSRPRALQDRHLMAEGCAFHSKVHVLPNPTSDRSEPLPSHARPRVSAASSKAHGSITVSDEVLRRHGAIRSLRFLMAGNRMKASTSPRSSLRNRYTNVRCRGVITVLLP